MSCCHHPRAAWLLTDARLAGHGVAAARRLRPGSIIILRSDDLDARARSTLARQLKRIARARRLALFVAGMSAARAQQIGADGVHLRSRSAQDASVARRHGLAVSAPVHNRAEARAAAAAHIDYALISPMFATRSHPGARTLPMRQFIRLALMAGAHPVALGGMGPARHRKLQLLGAASGIQSGWAAIDAWETGPSARTRQKRNCVPT